jgi:hypothetical protein
MLDNNSEAEEPEAKVPARIEHYWFPLEVSQPSHRDVDVVSGEASARGTWAQQWP